MLQLDQGFLISMDFSFRSPFMKSQCPCVFVKPSSQLRKTIWRPFSLYHNVHSHKNALKISFLPGRDGGYLTPISTVSTRAEKSAKKKNELLCDRELLWDRLVKQINPANAWKILHVFAAQLPQLGSPLQINGIIDLLKKTHLKGMQRPETSGRVEGKHSSCIGALGTQCYAEAPFSPCTCGAGQTVDFSVPLLSR